MTAKYNNLMDQYFGLSGRTTDDFSEDERYWFDCSSLSEYSAIAFCCGEEVYVMDIVAIDPSRIQIEEE